MNPNPNTLFLHIGIDKTGTTAIQSFLKNNEASLSRYGLTYLSALRTNLRHRLLREQSLDGNLDGWREISRELSTIGYRGIVSDEGLYHLPEEAWREICRLLSPHRVEVVIYIRRQSEMVCSGLAQRIKTNCYKKPPGEYTERDLIAVGMAYSRLLAKLAGVFGREHVHVGRYETSALKDENLVLDFFARMGFQIDQETLKREFRIEQRNPNPTLGVDAIQLLVELDETGIDPTVRKSIVGLLIEQGDRSTFVTEDQIAAVDKDFHSDNTLVARDWFGEQELFRDACRFRWRAVDAGRLSRYLRLIRERGLLSGSCDGWPAPKRNTETDEATERPPLVSAARADGTGRSTQMIVCLNSPWHPKDSHQTEVVGDVEYVFNRYHPDAIAVVDVKWSKTPLSAMFPPERRVWVHIEPIRLTDYFRGFEQYYAGGIVSWHTGLEWLPQTRQYRHGQRGGGTRDSDARKVFGLGGHVSAKNNPGMEGYRLRHEILAHEDEIGIPSTVFNYRGHWRGASHDYPRKGTDEVMDYMFHLTIENCRERHYFTEKIIRAFANFCVPLYYGDPCIAEEFDPGGIILLGEDNWLQTINGLTPTDYYDRIESVRRNYFLSMKYWTKLDRILALVNTTPAVREPIGGNGLYYGSRIVRSPGSELFEMESGYEIQDTKSGRRLVSCNAPAAVVYASSDGDKRIGDIAAEIGSSLAQADVDGIVDDVTSAALQLVESGALYFDSNEVASALTPVANEGYVLRQTEEGFLLEHGSAGTTLNAPAALVWTLCDGSRTLSDVIDRVLDEVGEPASDAIAKDVCQTIMRFSDRQQVSMRASVNRTSGRVRSTTAARARRRPRVLFLLTRFPQLSETYIKTEIAALRDAYDIGVIAFEDSNLRYANHHPYRVVKVRGNTMEDDIEEEHGTLTAAIMEFDPDILHTHYLHNVPVTARMAERFGIPFTVRAHSYDVMARGFRSQVGDGRPEPGPFPLRHSHLLNDERCLGVLTYPYTVPALASAGIREDKVIPCYPVVDFSAFYDRSPNAEGFLNVEPCLPKKAVTDFIDLARLMPGQRFSLYGMGHQIAKVREYNREAGSPVAIEDTVEPEEMPAVYKRHDWLIYTASFKTGNVGWPLAIFEAQAAGLGVCVANVHPHVSDQLGGAGFTYDSIQEIPDIVSQPYPDEMREAGFENAKKSDVHRHKHLLTDLWQPVLGPR